MPDLSGWEGRLGVLAAAHGVPGASLAVLAGGEVFSTAAGVLNVETGVEATSDSLFQVGSIGKAYTATVVMRLVDEGRLELDAPVVGVLPGFRVADAEVSRRVTVRHLLSHTSGIAGDFFEDTGRGDDCLQRYVEGCANLGQDVPLGATMSYSNTGYCILGRVIEVVTGMVWDDAMRQLLFEPLGLTHTVTLPEHALRYRTAWGHTREPDKPMAPVPAWDVPRMLGPVGGILASAPELVSFAHRHAELLSAQTAAEMQRPQVAVPDRWTTGDHWGLGWILQDWDGQRLYGHDGDTTGQHAALRVVPEHGVAIGLLTNGAGHHALWHELSEELLGELCGIAVPSFPEPAPAGAAGSRRLVGRYERFGLQLDIEPHDSGLRATERALGSASLLVAGDDEPVTLAVRPSTAGPDVYVSKEADDDRWWPLVLFEVDGHPYVHTGGRAQRRVSGGGPDEEG